MPIAFSLEDLGSLREGKLLQLDGAWFVETADGKRHNLNDMLAPFADKNVRVTVADLGLLSKAESEIRSMAQNVTGMTNAQLAAKLKKNSN